MCKTIQENIHTLKNYRFRQPPFLCQRPEFILKMWCTKIKLNEILTNFESKSDERDKNIYKFCAILYIYKRFDPERGGEIYFIPLMNNDDLQ